MRYHILNDGGETVFDFYPIFAILDIIVTNPRLTAVVDNNPCLSTLPDRIVLDHGFEGPVDNNRLVIVMECAILHSQMRLRVLRGEDQPSHSLVLDHRLFEHHAAALR